MKQNVSILTVNSGSSSLKLTLHKIPAGAKSPETVVDISIANIAAQTSTIKVADSKGRQASHGIHFADHTSALAAGLAVLSKTSSLDSLSAIGHRIVFGGERQVGAELITDGVIASLRQSARFDPDHMPLSLKLIDVLAGKFPALPQVACYDTAFFMNIPRLAQIIPLPSDLQVAGIRRYGYHGLSYSYVLSEFERVAGKRASKGRIIIAHLGSGASLAAVHKGVPVDMTMGFTPTSGVMMSSRSGDLDPGVGFFLQTEMGLSASDVYELVNKKSGLLGVSGTSADMKVLVQHYDHDPKSAEAVDLFCYQIRKAIGALASTIGGVDSIIFTGGIGEQSPFIRREICSGLGYMGVALDRASNEKHLELISAEHSAIGVHVLPTNEAVTIATLTHSILPTKKKSGLQS